MRYQFVDCRWELGKAERGRELYLAGHVPGASFVDLENDLSDTSIEGHGRHPLPSAERFAASAARAGIGDGVFVVAYGTMAGAERLWWLLRHFGHDGCAVIDLASWRGPLREGDETITPAVFTPRERSDDTVSVDELATRMGEGAAAGGRMAPLVLVDARLPARFRGEPNPIDQPPGRLPGAINAPWNAPPSPLPDGELVAYCGSGVTACVVLHRAQLAGRAGKLYPGSYSDWSKRGLRTERG